MAVLTEKEASLDWGLFTAEIYAEFRDGHIDGIWINLYFDGQPIKWLFGDNNQVQLMERGHLNRNWDRLMMLVNQEFSKVMQNKILELIK